MGTRIRSAVVVGLLGLLAACAEPSTSAADGQSTETATNTTKSTDTTESSAPVAAGECPVGAYQVQSLTAQDDVTVSGQQVRVADVQGLTLEFTEDGTWKLAGDGATISVSASGLTAGATVNGMATGDYAKADAGYVFTQTSAEGSITFDQAIAGIESIPMSEFGPAIAPSGATTITCTETGATLSAENAVLELTGGTGGAQPGTEAPGGGEPAPTVINSSGDTKSFSCTGGPVTINGSDNDLTFSGTCSDVNINGSSNRVAVAAAGVVNLNGSQNQLTWTGAKPQVNDNGRANTVTEG